MYERSPRRRRTSTTERPIPWRLQTVAMGPAKKTGFSHKKYYGAAPTILPRAGLGRKRRIVENQVSSLRCAAYAAAVGNGYIRNTRFHPDWQAIKIGEKQGRSVDLNGSDPRATMNSLRDNGSILWDAAVPHLATHGIDGTNDRFEYPGTSDDQAQNNRITAYLSVDDAHDYFDDIRHALYRAYHVGAGTGAVVHAFSEFFTEWINPEGGIIPKEYRLWPAGTRTSSSTGARSRANSISSHKTHTAMSVTTASSTSRAKS